MNWDQEIQIEGKEGDKVTLTIGELHSLLLDLAYGLEIYEMAIQICHCGP